MITIVSFKWKKDDSGYRLNSGTYTADHVNKLFRSLKRNSTIPFRFVCVTDDKSGIDSDIEIIDLWDKCRNLGGCYNRLYIFSQDMKNIFGDRFLTIDLDCVVVGNIDSILTRNEDFLINKFIGKGNLNQKYNGSLIMMNSGARETVWSRFNFDESAKYLDNIRTSRLLIGSDQAWIQTILGENEITFSDSDGIYDYSFLPDRQVLPDNAKIIFFPGRVDPSAQSEHVDWIKTYWR